MHPLARLQRGLEDLYRIEGRWVEPEDTARILARYEEWAGLACVYLMAGASRGLVPLKLSRPEVRRERIRARRAA